MRTNMELTETCIRICDKTGIHPKMYARVQSVIAEKIKNTEIPFILLIIMHMKNSYLNPI